MGGVCHLELSPGELVAMCQQGFCPEPFLGSAGLEAELIDALLWLPSSWALLPSKERRLTPLLPQFSGLFHHLPKTEGPWPLGAWRGPAALQPRSEASQSEMNC